MSRRQILDGIGLLRPALRPHHDAVGRDVLDHAGPLGHHHRARVPRDHVLHAGADQRRLRLQQRHGLALHVRAHERAVGVVVLEERNQRRRHRHQLLGRDVHVVHVFGRHHPELAALAGRDALLHEACPVRSIARVGLGDDELLLLQRGEEVDLVGDPPADDLAVRRLDEAELVDPRVRRERRDEADVRAFRRLDRADAAVVRGVHVAHLEAGALAGETARPERRQPALVGQLGQRVGLVHELRELGRAEELLDHRRDRLGVDQVVRHQVRDVGDRHPLLDRPLHAGEADAELVLQQLADRAHAAVAEVVDVVGRLAAELDQQQVPDDGDDVLAAQRLGAEPGHRC